MAFSGNFDIDTRRNELEELIDDSGESDDEYDYDDSDRDPSYSIEEETNFMVSRTSIRKKPKPLEVVDLELIAEAEKDDLAPDVPILNENDEKCIREVLSFIKGGKIEKLKVEQCKAYLRKNGLRLTGTKDVLIQRINEHLEILNGGGEKKYPDYSFIVNCKGDACMGDVVMFEQKVYEMYNKASRSSAGPSCGARTVAGRIVKESYGASKQQHTFTIEVLWSKGEKPLPPLHPLLIKGRNLYRMKTMRQTWEDEGERQKVLMEKHARGSLARSNREARVGEREKRTVHKENRKPGKEGFSAHPFQSNLSSAGTMLAESMVKLSVDSRQVAHRHIQGPLLGNSCKPIQHRQSENPTKQTKSDPFFDDHRRRPFQIEQMKANPPPASYNTIHPNMYRDDYYRDGSVNKVVDGIISRTSWDDHSRLPMAEMNLYYSKVNQPAQENCNNRKQRCRYFAVGRCYYGENCKFSHEMTEDYVGRDKERCHHHHIYQNARLYR